MKNALLSFILLCLSTPLFAAGQVAPYDYEYYGDPTGVSTSIINPGVGAVIIDGSTTHRAIKLSPRGSNATFATQNFIISGTVPLSGTTGQISAIATLPGNGGTYVFTSAQVVCTTGTSVSVAPVMQIVSGTGNTALSGTGTTLSGTASSTYTVLSPQSAAPLVLTGTGGITISVKTTNAGTSNGLFTGKAFVHGFFLP